MAQRLNPAWVAEKERAVYAGQPIDCTTSANIAIQTLIVLLTRASRAFKLYNLGAGVKRITTETTVCPCCKKPL